MDWRERYEIEARKALDALAPLDEAELLRRVRAGNIDQYFAIWREIGRAGTVEQAAPVLWSFLADHPGKHWMLHRYHCAAALFRILELEDPGGGNELRKRVQWDHEGEEARQAALLELQALIDERRTPAP